MTRSDREELEASTIQDVDLDVDEVLIGGVRYTEADAEDDAEWADLAADRRA